VVLVVLVVVLVVVLAVVPVVPALVVSHASSNRPDLLAFDVECKTRRDARTVQVGDDWALLVNQSGAAEINPARVKAETKKGEEIVGHLIVQRHEF